jgi:hypothetical protein
MTRLLAGKLFKVKADVKLIHAGMNYSYYNVWKHMLQRNLSPGLPNLFPLSDAFCLWQN